MRKLINRGLCTYHRDTAAGFEADADSRALFSQALAELKYLGMIKSSRKKADHLVKLAWKGL